MWAALAIGALICLVFAFAWLPPDVRPYLIGVGVIFCGVIPAAYWLETHPRP